MLSICCTQNPVCTINTVVSDLEQSLGLAFGPEGHGHVPCKTWCRVGFVFVQVCGVVCPGRWERLCGLTDWEVLKGDGCSLVQ